MTRKDFKLWTFALLIITILAFVGNISPIFTMLTWPVYVMTYFLLMEETSFGKSNKNKN